jgi:3-mercaptopyruvate sulfurtransferase SseA
VPSDGEEHVFYCQSGVRTTQLIFGMHRAGWPLRALKNYDGSWVEWSARSEE